MPVGSIVGAGDASTLLYFVLPVWLLGTIVGLLVRGVLDLHCFCTTFDGFE